MSTFRNRTGKKLILDTPTHEKFELEPNASFTGNNYYKRFTTGDYAVLALVSDDGAEYNGNGYESGAVMRQVTKVVTSGSAFADNLVNVLTVVGGPAHYIQMESTKNVDCRFNGDTSGAIRLNANEVQIFNTGDILANKIEFDSSFSGSETATVTIVLIGKPTNSADPS